MKDWKRMFLCSVTAAAALSAVVAQQASAADIKPPMAKFSMVSDVVMEKCMACHSRNYDLPFYAKIPVSARLSSRITATVCGPWI